MRAANKREDTPPADESGRRKNAAKRARRMLKNQADAMPVVAPVDTPRAERVVDAELVPPSPRGGLVEVLQQPYLLRLIVSRQLAQMYAASLLGLAWSYVQPAMRFGVYYVVMGFLLNGHAGTPYFAIHLFTGMVAVHYFGETWNGGTRSIWGNKSMVQKNRMPREIFPVSAMLVAAYHTMPQVLVLVVFCLISGWHLTWAAVAAGVLGVSIIVTFAMALALIFSALNVFYRDFQNIVQTCMQFMHFLVPMMYAFSRVWSMHEQRAAAPAVLLVPAGRAPAPTDRRSLVPSRHLGARSDHARLLPRVVVAGPEVLLPSRRKVPGAALMTVSIVVENVTKEFTMQYHRTLKQMAVATVRRLPLQEKFLAVNDVSFTVEQGESVGLMGLNGSGKSTLLKLINGVMRPDVGSILTRGRIAGLIATGAGFQAQLTGRENLFLNAAIMGMSEAETKRKFDAIVDFADIGKFMDTPVSHYSSGMYARLGFSIAIHVDADIFLADEVLAVGDRPFKKKCMAKMQEVRAQGTTIFYVSHASASVKAMCDRVLVLESGRLNYDSNIVEGGSVEGGIHYLEYDDDDEVPSDEELGADI